MKEDLVLKILPHQLQGSQMDAVETKEFPTTAVADEMYQLACKRLFNINGWTEYAGLSEFVLIDRSGLRADRTPKIGDHIRIDIPGPGPIAGRGYDWVHIEKLGEIVEKDEKLSYITVRPCPYPLSEMEGTAHFLDHSATSTFLIRQSGKVVSAEEHGRNEIPNSSDINVVDKGRNFLVGMAAKIGLSYPQWKSLVIGLLAEESAK